MPKASESMSSGSTSSAAPCVTSGNEEKIDAVVRNIEIIGEATTCLDRSLKAKYPQVEWRFATAIRNRLIHGYFDVDAEIIWNTTQNDLPKLKTEIEKISEELKK